MRLAVPLLLVLVMPATSAQRGDPLQAPECTAALQALSAEEEAVLAQRPGLRAEPRPAAVPPRLLQRRQAAARACLGTEDAPTSARARVQRPLPAAGLAGPGRWPNPSGPSGPPRSVPLPVGASGAQAGTPPSPSRAPPVVTITSCDAQGCWASDGTRLIQTGPNLLGPRGFCTRQGALLNCP